MDVEVYKKLVGLGEREFNPMETLQLLTQYNTMIWFSWGVPTSSIKILGNKGLLFRVNGHHYKGLLLITLSWMDTYTVHKVKSNGEVIDLHQGIYFDQLQEIIDNWIERIPEYKR